MRIQGRERSVNLSMVVAFAVAAGVALFTAMLIYFGDLPETHDSQR